MTIIEITRFAVTDGKCVQVAMSTGGAPWQIPVYVDLPTETEPRYRIDTYDPATSKCKRHYRKTESGVESVTERFMAEIGHPLDPGALLMVVGGWSIR